MPNTLVKEHKITRKINRITKQQREKSRHKISREHGRSTKALWSKIVDRSRNIK